MNKIDYFVLNPMNSARIAPSGLINGCASRPSGSCARLRSGCAALALLAALPALAALAWCARLIAPLHPFGRARKPSGPRGIVRIMRGDMRGGLRICALICAHKGPYRRIRRIHVLGPFLN